MDYSFKMEVGKYKGKTIEEILEIDSDYISWAQDDAPHILRPRKKASTTSGAGGYKKPTGFNAEVQDEKPKYKIPENDRIESSMKPNLDFWNQVGEGHFPPKKQD
jgi:hypothetical protein